MLYRDVYNENISTNLQMPFHRASGFRVRDRGYASYPDCGSWSFLPYIWSTLVVSFVQGCPWCWWGTRDPNRQKRLDKEQPVVHLQGMVSLNHTTGVTQSANILHNNVWMYFYRWEFFLFAIRGRIVDINFNFSFKKSKIKIFRESFFLYRFLLESGGTLTQNSYKPSQDLWEAT